MHGVPVSEASAITAEEWKKVKASEKKMKKYKDLYEQEKQRHEDTFQRYQEDHMDEMEIVNLHKRCNKEVPRPKKASSNSDKPKKVIKSLEFLDDPSEGKQNSRAADGKRPLQRWEKKLKIPHSLTNHHSHVNLLTRAWKKKKKSQPRMIMFPLYYG